MTTEEGTTEPLPPACTTVLSEPKPMTATFFRGESGSSSPLFLSSTVHCAASLRADLTEASVVTLWPSFL